MIKKNLLHFESGQPAIKTPLLYGFVRYSGIGLNAEYYLFPFNYIERLKDRLKRRRLD